MDSLQSLQSLVTLVSLILLVLFPNLQFTSSNKTASFSLKLFHRDSPESPIYPGAMTFQEKVERYMKISESRISYWKSINMHNRTIQPNMMRPVVGSDGFIYIVELEIGDPPKTYYLVLDTGSGLTWLQCQPCKECFHQKYDIYDPKQSHTYNKVPCDNPLCQYFKCINQHCSYTINYMDKSFTQGYAAWETFHIKDEHGDYTNIHDVLFGCSNLNHGFDDGSHDLKSGIMGLNQNPVSFITQMGSFIMRRFSYCLVDPFLPGISHISYLKFGMDMGYIGGPVQKTPFVKLPNFYAYALNLLDISVNNRRLNYPPGTFKFKPGGDGGFIIDSGSVLTYIDNAAYSKLEDEFVRYFSAFKQLKRNQNCPFPTKLCYNASTGFPLFPSVTYHFEGADLTIEPENAFIAYPEEKIFIAGIAPGETSILGSYQQHNTRFVYDLDLNVLAFVRDDCSKDETLEL